MGTHFAQQIVSEMTLKGHAGRIITRLAGIPQEGTVHLHMEPSRTERGHILGLLSWLHEECMCVMYLISASEVEMCR